MPEKTKPLLNYRYMCGIAGIISKKRLITDSVQLQAMTRAVSHRGPDGEGILIEGKVGFGHRRLSIIDLSADGHQPMNRQDYGLSIVFNGEIYNYIELREELLGLGHDFVTATDTEVILVAYYVWGEQCVSHFNGMWSFAILDRFKNKVFCSRDRFGVKPFYYADSPDNLIFGSEIRQLLPFIHGIYANIKVVEEFLFADISEQVSETFFEGINKLPGGHNLIYDLGSNSFTINRYYELNVNPALENIGLDEGINILGNQFLSAVLLRLRADVRVGTCLSGGLDSSSIATLASAPYKKACGESFRAITSISEQKSNDESFFAEQVVAHADLEWLTTKPTYQDYAENIEEIVRAQEEPFGGPSICMQFFVLKTARKNGIPVLLDGQGGDETLLGYEKYYTAYFLNIIKSRGFIPAIKSLKECWTNNSKMSPGRILLYLPYFASARLRYWNYCYRNRYLRRIPSLPETMKKDAKAVWNLTELQKLELTENKLPHLLRFEDKNAMWHSVETRLPFLDYRVVETAISLPWEAKINNGWTKYALRRFMDGKMPDTITWRKNKNGFEAPNQLWSSRHATIMLETVLSSTLLKGLSKTGSLEKLFPKLDIETRFRLYEVALWEKEFAVKSQIN